MAQFDSLIIFPLLWSTLFILVIHYSISIEMLIPSFFGVKKFREKKLDSPTFYSFLKSNMKSDFSYSNAS
nr:ATP synthase F0 subunit 8 [Schizostauron trachyderma]